MNSERIKQSKFVKTKVQREFKKRVTSEEVQTLIWLSKVRESILYFISFSFYVYIYVP